MKELKLAASTKVAEINEPFAVLDKIDREFASLIQRFKAKRE